MLSHATIAANWRTSRPSTVTITSDCFTARDENNTRTTSKTASPSHIARLP